MFSQVSVIVVNEVLCAEGKVRLHVPVQCFCVLCVPCQQL